MLRPLFLSVLFLFSLATAINGQVIKKPDYHISINSLPYFGEQTPFWLVANKQGKYLPGGYNNTLEAKLKGDIDQERNISLGYGFEGVNRYNQGNKAYINQAYLQAKIYFVKILAGAKTQYFGNHDSTLTSGGLLWSNNARPMPKVSIGTNDFIDVPFTRGYIEIDGAVEHGWLESNRDGWMETPRYVKNAFLHHKYYNIRFGGDLPVNFRWGLHHYVEWGGNSPDYGKLPTDLNAYYKIFIAQSGNVTDIPNEVNQYGNHLGGRVMGLDIKLKDYSLSLYWQSLFEDGSGLNWQNSADGLYGLNIDMGGKDQIISGICSEYLHTIDQSGPVHDNEEGLKGNDNYFNNGVYRSGWSYYGFSMGTPFITSPVYNETGDRFQNNKVSVHHYGFEGNIYKEIYYKLMVSLHDNYGTNRSPYDYNLGDFSAILSLNFPVKVLTKWDITTKFAYDTGEMYGYNQGFMISIAKTGSF